MYTEVTGHQIREQIQQTRCARFREKIGRGLRAVQSGAWTGLFVFTVATERAKPHLEVSITSAMELVVRNEN
jgi:hypothetical protein